MSFPFRRAALWLVPAWVALALASRRRRARSGCSSRSARRRACRAARPRLRRPGPRAAELGRRAAGHVPPVFGGLAARDPPAAGSARPTSPASTPPPRRSTCGRSSARCSSRARAARRARAAAGSSSPTGSPTAASARCARSRSSRPGSWSASNASGDAIVAWTRERSPFVRVSERKDGRGFGPPRDLAIARSAAVAINARGDRLLAWPDGPAHRRARAPRAAASWGRPGASAACRSTATAGCRRSSRPTGACSSRGAATAATAASPCATAAARGACGAWSGAAARRRSARARRPSCRSPTPSGATYVAWTHAHAAGELRDARARRAGRAGRAAASSRASAARCSTTSRPARTARSPSTWAAVLSKDEPAADRDLRGVRRARRRLRGRSGCRRRARSSRAAAASRFSR